MLSSTTEEPMRDFSSSCIGPLVFVRTGLFTESALGGVALVVSGLTWENALKVRHVKAKIRRAQILTVQR